MVFARFWQNRDGGVAPFLALAAIPLMGFTGAGIDYSRASVRTHGHAGRARRDRAQPVEDRARPDRRRRSRARRSRFSTRCSSARKCRTSPITTDVQLARSRAISSSTSPAAAPSRRCSAKVIGHSEISFGSKSEVLWGIKKLNLALALDNTGSMNSSGKMTALKTAAHNLLDTLKKRREDTGRHQGVDRPVRGRRECRHAERRCDLDRLGGLGRRQRQLAASRRITRRTAATTTAAPGRRSTTASGTAASTTATRTTTSRTRRPDPAPRPSTARIRPSACPTAMMTLSTDWTAMHTKIDAMTPTGNTNVTIGLQMALADVVEQRAVQRAGARARSRQGDHPAHRRREHAEPLDLSSTSSIDARTQKACDNVKAANIKLYTVRVIDGNATLLKNCATKPDMYYDVRQCRANSTACSRRSRRISPICASRSKRAPSALTVNGV